MGAKNVAAAYLKFAGLVPSTSLVCLVYMALVSMDRDEAPWYGEGHAALAEHALGRPLPISRADIKAVERAITPLLAAKALTVVRRAAKRIDGGNTVKYRLELGLDSHSPRFPGDVNPDIDHQRPPENGLHVPRKTGARPPENGGLRRHEEYRRSEKRKTQAGSRTCHPPAHESQPNNPKNDPNRCAVKTDACEATSS